MRVCNGIFIMQPIISEPFEEIASSSDSESDFDHTDSDSSTSSRISSSTDTTSTSTSASSLCDDPFDESFDFNIDEELFLDDDDHSDRLFEGSSLSVLATVSLLMSWFANFPGINKQALSQLFNILHHCILLSGNLLPADYKRAYSMIKSRLVPVTEYHACPNDCILYRGAHIDATHCPKCGEERFLDRGIPKKNGSNTCRLVHV